MDEPTSSLQRDDVAHLFALIRRLSAKGSGSSTSATSSKRCARSPTCSPSCATAAAWRTGRLARSPTPTLVAHMVGRSVDQLFPVARAGAGRERPRGEGPGGAASRQPGVVHAPARRDSRHRRADGIGPHGAGPRAVRPRAGGVRHGAHCRRDGRSCRDALAAHRAACRLPQRGPQGRGARAADVGGRQPDDDGLLGVCQPRLAEPVAAAQRDAALDRRPRASRPRGPDQPVRTLSGGNQQKVALGRLLLQDADVLLLDEPTRGVDIGSKAQIYEAIAQAAQQRQGGADGQLLPARAVRPLRPARRHEPGTAVSGAPDRRMDARARAARRHRR